MFIQVQIINKSKPSRKITRLICKSNIKPEPGFLLKIRDKIFLITRVENLGGSNFLMDILAESIPQDNFAIMIFPKEEKDPIYSDGSQYITAFLRSMGFKITKNPMDAKILILTKTENILRCKSIGAHEKIIIAPSVNARKEDFLAISEHLRKISNNNIWYSNAPLQDNYAYFHVFGLRVIKPPVLAYPIRYQDAILLGSSEDKPIAVAHKNLVVLSSEGYLIPLDKIDEIPCDNTLLLLKIITFRPAQNSQREKKVTTIQVTPKLFENIIDTQVNLSQQDFDSLLRFLSILGISPIKRNDSLMIAEVYIPLPLSGKTASIEVSGNHIKITTKNHDTLDTLRRIINSFLLFKAKRDSIKKEVMSKIVKLLIIQKEILKCKDMIELEFSWLEISNQLANILELAKNEFSVNKEQFESTIKELNQKLLPKKTITTEKAVIFSLLDDILDECLKNLFSLIEEL